MNEPIWITVPVLIANHSELIAEHGGVVGIRDYNLLESACAAPKQLYHYTNPKPSLAEMAACYAYRLTSNHPFNDGNKRISAIACELFLDLNNCLLAASDEESFLIFTDLAKGNITEDHLTKWLQQKLVTP